MAFIQESLKRRAIAGDLLRPLNTHNSHEMIILLGSHHRYYGANVCLFSSPPVLFVLFVLLFSIVFFFVDGNIILFFRLLAWPIADSRCLMSDTHTPNSKLRVIEI